ncbi:MAG: hypothetical protein MZV64_26370 [Ignavibacteriales bacterium]|nr:hypothetical protein [Ignavibacteriales bacterium]
MEASAMVENELDLNANKGIILSHPSWHAGIIGIVASKIVEKYYRPAILITIDEEKQLREMLGKRHTRVKLV